MIAFTIMIVIFFLCVICLIIYLGGKECPKASTSKISETIKNDSDSNIIEQEVKLIQKERNIEALKSTLSSLEANYNMFKYYKNNQYIFLGIRLDQWWNHHEYEYMLVTDQKISPTIYINGAALFTPVETQQLYSIFSVYNEMSLIYKCNSYKLNKGTKLYDTIMTRIDNYYQNQIETINKKLKNN